MKKYIVRVIPTDSNSHITQFQTEALNMQSAISNMVEHSQTGEYKTQKIELYTGPEETFINNHFS